MLSYFHMNIHTETFVPRITCVIDDTDREKMQQQVYQVHDVNELKQRLIDV